MPKTLFEDYLREKHAEYYTGTDDDMSDKFEHWLIEEDIDRIIKFGNEFAEKLQEERMKWLKSVLPKVFSPINLTFTKESFEEGFNHCLDQILTNATESLSGKSAQE